MEKTAEKDMAAAMKKFCPRLYKKLQTEKRLGSLQRLTGKPETLEERIRRQQEPCRNCDGVHCGQPTRGFYPCLLNGTETMVMCRHEGPRRKQEKIQRLMKVSGLPPYLAKKTWADYVAYDDNADRAKKVGQHLAQDGLSSGLYISGPKGTGKTFLAALIARDRIQAGQPTMFVFVPELMAAFRQGIKDGNEGEILQTVKESDVLVLDDIGAERPTEYVAERIMDLVNYRYSHCLPTIFTSNYGLDELARHLSGRGGDPVTGERIVSRIAAMTYALRLNGQDQRLVY